MTINDEIDQICTGNDTSVSAGSNFDDTAEEALEDYGASQISPQERDEYDLVVEVEGTEYGLDSVDESAAALESEFNEREDADVYRTRGSRGSLTGDILSPQTGQSDKHAEIL